MVSIEESLRDPTRTDEFRSVFDSQVDRFYSTRAGLYYDGHALAIVPDTRFAKAPKGVGPTTYMPSRPSRAYRTAPPSILRGYGFLSPQPRQDCFDTADVRFPSQ